MSVDVNKVPAIIRSAPNWVLWKFEPIKGNTSGKLAKVPYSPISMRRASTTNPQDWGSIDQALDTITNHPQKQFNGIGLVLTKELGIIGVDLDHCLYNSDLSLKPWARVKVEALASYTEISPSGEGLHVLIQASLGDRLTNGMKKFGPCEIYEELRYLTFTGIQYEVLGIDTSKEIEQRQEAIETVYNQTEYNWNRLHDAMSDKLYGAKVTKLFKGDWAQYASQSEADLALCTYLAYWFDRQEPLIEQMFSMSALWRSKWDEQRGTHTYGEKTLAKAVEGSTSAPANPSTTSVDERATDMGNSSRFIRFFRDTLFYCPQVSSWYEWQGHWWQPNESEVEFRHAKAAIKLMYDEAATISDKRERDAAIQHIIRTEQVSRLSAMIKLSQGDMAVNMSKFDNQDYWLPVANGVLDLKTGKLIEDVPRDTYLTMVAGVPYIPQAECPMWMRFLGEVTEGNRELELYLQRMVGYILTADRKEQCFAIFYGSGANGKSTFLAIISQLLGEYAKSTSTNTFMAKRDGTEANNDIARLRGSRLVTAIETAMNRKLAEGIVKTVTGGDKIPARFLYGEYFEFNPKFHCIIATNHKPVISGVDHAIWRRVHLVPWNYQVSDENKIQNLPQLLSEELPGILNWALDGCIEWQRIGLAPPETVVKATQEYREQMDIIGEFLETCTETGGSCFLEEIYRHWISWSQDKGEHQISQRELNDRISDRSGIKKKKSNGRWKFEGLSVKGL